MRTEQTEQLTLLSLQRELALATDIDVVLRRIAEAATTLLGAERTTVYVVDHERAEVWSRVLTESELREIRLPLDGQGLASEVARNGEVLRVDDPYGDPRFDASVDARTGYRTRSMLVAPIDARDRSRLGVLQAVNKIGGDAFSKDDESVIRSLAGSAAIALEYVALNAQLAQERLRVVKVTEETRHRLARDLHDGVAQTLANAAIGIEIAQRQAKTDVSGAMAEWGGCASASSRPRRASATSSSPCDRWRSPRTGSGRPSARSPSGWTGPMGRTYSRAR